MDQISPSTAGAGIMPPAPGGGGGGGVAEGLPVEGAAGTGERAPAAVAAAVSAAALGEPSLLPAEEALRTRDALYAVSA